MRTFLRVIVVAATIGVVAVQARASGQAGVYGRIQVWGAFALVEPAGAGRRRERSTRMGGSQVGGRQPTGRRGVVKLGANGGPGTLVALLLKLTER